MQYINYRYALQAPNCLSSIKNEKLFLEMIFHLDANEMHGIMHLQMLLESVFRLKI